MNNFSESLKSLLEEALQPTELHIQDDSAAHAGHGAKGGHYNIQLASPKFSNKSIIQCHRMVNQAVQQTFQDGRLHALSIKIIRK